MSYNIIISKSVQKQIDSLSDELRMRISEKVNNLREEPRPQGVVKLKGHTNEYRLRVGDLIIVFVMKLMILIKL